MGEEGRRGEKERAENEGDGKSSLEGEDRSRRGCRRLLCFDKEEEDDWGVRECDEWCL